jgi:hypothetical protein
MEQRAQLRILFHGAIILLIGMLLGIPYAFAITDNWGDEAVHAWRVAHVGIAAAGLLLLIVGAVFEPLELTPQARQRLVQAILLSGYGFTVSLPLAAMAGVRGLEPGGPFFNWVVVAANTLGAGGGFVATWLMIRGYHAALQRV